MTVTDADRAAAREAMHKVRGYEVKLPHGDHWMIQAFARHREQAEQGTVAEIVAWLRDQQHGRTSDNYPGYYARRIEAGEWKQ